MFLCNYLIRKVSCKKLLKLSSVFFVLRPLVIFLAPNLAVAFLGFALQSLSLESSHLYRYFYQPGTEGERQSGGPDHIRYGDRGCGKLCG